MNTLSPAALFDLTGRRALVTGSSRGIGRAIALGLAAAGAEILVHGASESEALREVARAISAGGGKAETIHADLSDADACRALVKRLAPHGIDILVANASFERRLEPGKTSDADFDAMLHVNLRASMLLAEGLLPAMETKGWGRVLFLGSIQEVKPNPMMLVYAASKSAQTNMARNLSRRVAGHGVTVNVLSPGAIATDRNRAVLADAAYRARVEAQIPTGRVGAPEDCVGAALLLCSGAGAYINGAVVPVDGGWAVS